MRTKINLNIKTYVENGNHYIIIKSRKWECQYENWDLNEAIRDFLLNIRNI